DEPFAVLLGDDIVQAEQPCLRQLLEEYDKTLSSVIGVQTVPEYKTHHYGIVDVLAQEGRRYQVRNFVEKPAAGTASSNFAIMIRYVLTPAIFLCFEQQHVGAGGALQLTDAIHSLNEIHSVLAYDFEGKSYDVGVKVDLVATIIEMTLQHAD
ncbi:sugar phosphate nucleotidyltransferase, partial [Bacillus sp. S2-R3J1-FB-BA1]|uniref:sugar phosphate nucleotidyltransferase n=1 Tax=Bacillus sp. S2-R3J1-FB-BA1 TaxID=1973490 RepID=UPI002101535C